MIELKRDALVFSFPEVHTDARCRIDSQRTLLLRHHWQLVREMG